ALADDSLAMFRLALVGLAELALGAETSMRISPLEPRARDRLLEAMAPTAQDEGTRRAALVVAAVVGEPGAIDLAIDALIDDRVSREADAAPRIFGSAALPRILARVAHGDATL